MVQGPAYQDWDFSVFKDIPIRESEALAVPGGIFQLVQPREFPIAGQ